MASYYEHHSPQPETDSDDLYGDHVGGHPEQNGDARERDHASVHGRNRDVTWITSSQFPSRNPSIIPRPLPPPAAAVTTPSRPLPVPTTPMPPGGFEPSEEMDAEYMNVDPEEDFEGWNGGQDFQSQWRKPGPRKFVGGFVNGLKRLPRAVLRKPVRRGTDNTAHTGDTLPTYHSPILTGPSVPNVIYVEATEMPVEHLAPTPSDVHSHLSDGRSHMSRHNDGRSHHTDVLSHHSHHTNPDARSHHSYRDDRSHHTDGRSHHTSHSIDHENTYDTHATVAVHSALEHERYDPETAETTLGHIPAPAAVLSPEAVELRPSSDYDKMEPPPSPSVLSLNSRFVRVGQFFQDLYDLPWVATRITVDYIPAEQSRAQYARKTRATWYPGEQSPIDLLSGEPTPPLRKISPPNNNNNGHNRVPNSSGILAYANGRPDGRNRSPPYGRSGSPPYDQHRSRSPPFSRHAQGEQYPVYPRGYAPEYAAPQPLYMYPSAIPQAQPPVGMPSNTANVAERGQEQQDMQQVRPVYIVAPSPPRPFMPPPPEQAHAPPGTYYPYPVSHPPGGYPA